MIIIKKDKYLFNERTRKSINGKCMNRLNRALCSYYTGDETHIIKNVLTNKERFSLNQRRLRLGAKD